MKKYNVYYRKEGARGLDAVSVPATTVEQAREAFLALAYNAVYVYAVEA